MAQAVGPIWSRSIQVMSLQVPHAINSRQILSSAILLIFSLTIPSASAIAQTPETPSWFDGTFRWKVGSPLISVADGKLPESPDHPWLAIKDPSVVRHDGRWHMFCSVRKKLEGNGRIRIGYLSFDHWEQANQADWQILDLTDEYHGAPQIFFFEPQQTWYLIYQAVDSSRGLKYGPCFSTNKDITNAQGWTRPKPLYVVKEGMKAGLDFWVICDEQDAFLFFTSLDGRMWRAQTKLSDFPDSGWSDPVVALHADIFEASHTYAISNTGKYLTFVEAQQGRRRYFKAYLADNLASTWKPLADSLEKPFVSPINVTNQADSWAQSYSHGELIRESNDQRMEISPTDLQLVFQGASDQEYRTGSYGDIPWRLGQLSLVVDSILPAATSPQSQDDL
ncbi:hypothetical protein LOC67_11055 [Stieleria sp. JC731]|uniref:non-reducing end alpha-L-arabinofuranosidase family hydrolase n=1 Tax=Pirellulaceae TaxID=2691357 RepID=UPI001E3D9FAB|nr:non-reducing end alpha-L-arabinofuranosidase family hydrolase [Stieleria sp. JC731]MCC9601085.1 hypothetical protein [Stieleria sp. JC731]